LDTFFSKSRLSFIGSFRQRARTSPSKAPRSNESLRSERWVLHVDIDSFFASVVLRDYPQYRDSPVVISHQANQAGLQHNPSRSSTSECATCNYKVRSREDPFRDFIDS
jgi:DNA repair protein REV1